MDLWLSVLDALKRLAQHYAGPGLAKRLGRRAHLVDDKGTVAEDAHVAEDACVAVHDAPMLQLEQIPVLQQGACRQALCWVDPLPHLHAKCNML